MVLSGGAQDGAGPDPAAKPDRTMLVLYGSETGNSQEIAEDIDRIAQKLRFKSTLAEMNSVQPVRISISGSLVFLSGMGCDIEFLNETVTGNFL
jgi:sulfite reductase alpha subunit-like flavoprotein